MAKNPKNKSNKFTMRNIETIKSLTHLFLNDKNIEKIDPSLQLSTLSVLYYHNNKITKIENLQTAVNLRHLYLQRNKIEKIENLNCLVNLEKLYLGYNKISVIEGLEKLHNLRELHLEKQDLDGDSLCFDSRSINGIASSLEMLIIPHNNITTLESLSPLKYLTYVDASYNNLTNIREASDAVYNWYYLYEARFVGNPITKQSKYRENVISSSHKLGLLDNKEVSEVTRCFLKRFEQEKSKKFSQKSINIPEWTKEYGHPSLQKAAYKSIISKPNLAYNEIGNNNAADNYLPWKALPRSRNKVGKFTTTSSPLQ
ncbi:hypothetical protein FQR65_LT13978 [Abscondita terminalis]|nr:hypothetical protein FQR65_LT13978 [Abscondita terminalis]